MARAIFKRSRKAGLPPGSLVYVGEERTGPITIRRTDYSPESFSETAVDSLDECATCLGGGAISWVHVDGLHEVGLLERLGRMFNIHALVLEDILNTNQRPKIDLLGEHIYVVVKALWHDKEKDELVSEQVSLLLGGNYVISLQETGRDIFGPVRKRIENSKGRIRNLGPDYLLYALVDQVVDGYFALIEDIDDDIDELEDRVYGEPSEDTVIDIHVTKRELGLLRKLIAPLREVVRVLQLPDSDLFRPETEMYLRDLQDHVVQALDAVESHREITNGLLDIYMTNVSNKMNEVMKVLTIIATIFIPLSFVAGVYGMNFNNMPELKWDGAYYVVLGAMCAAAMLMLGFFKKKKWL